MEERQRTVYCRRRARFVVETGHIGLANIPKSEHIRSRTLAMLCVSVYYQYIVNEYNIDILNLYLVKMLLALRSQIAFTFVWAVSVFLYKCYPF